MLNRRRFLTIAASAAAIPSMAKAKGEPLHVETGIALGAKIVLRLYAEDGAELARAAMAEIHRLERIFSLYLPGSELVRLNKSGFLKAPSFELLDCLAVVDRAHRASAGRFDPTIQPLWRLHADAAQSGTLVRKEDVKEALKNLGWDQVRFTSEAVEMNRGMSLSLNGIAQGYIADRVVDFLAKRGLANGLIDTGELHALGSPPGGGAWNVRLPDNRQIDLRHRALATSAPLGMTFGGDGVTGHIIDPSTGYPVSVNWAGITISASSAAIADALSTAACLYTDEAEIHALCAKFADARLESAIRKT